MASIRRRPGSRNRVPRATYIGWYRYVKAPGTQNRRTALSGRQDMPVFRESALLPVPVRAGRMRRPSGFCDRGVFETTRRVSQSEIIIHPQSGWFFLCGQSPLFLQRPQGRNTFCHLHGMILLSLRFSSAFSHVIWEPTSFVHPVPYSLWKCYVFLIAIGSFEPQA